MPAVYFLISMSSRYTMPVLHNRISNETLKAQMLAETEPRTTISFYKYFTIVDPQATRDALWVALTQLKVFGRIYLAREGSTRKSACRKATLRLCVSFSMASIRRWRGCVSISPWRTMVSLSGCCA